MITVAHISDLHALRLDGTSPLAFLSLKRLGGSANLLLKRRHKHPVRLFSALVDELNRVGPDHVAVTGDLTNLSLDAEFAFARAELDRLALGPAAVSVVPGNHDVYVPSAARRRAFESHVGPYATSDNATDGAAAFPFVRARGGLAVIGISTARPSPIPFADGRAGAAQIAAVEAALRAHADRFRLVLLHHPPVENRHAFLRGLRDREALQAALARAGAELVVHGHEHRDLRTAIPGPGGEIPVVGVGSGTYDDPRPERRARFNLIRIDGKRFTIETRVHDAATGRWEPRGTIGSN